MWLYMGQRSFKLTPEQYAEKLDGAARLVNLLGQTDKVGSVQGAGARATPDWRRAGPGRLGLQAGGDGQGGQGRRGRGAPGSGRRRGGGGVRGGGRAPRPRPRRPSPWRAAAPLTPRPRPPRCRVAWLQVRAFLSAPAKAVKGLPKRPVVGTAVSIQLDLTEAQVAEWFGSGYE